jgi:dUTPase
MKFKKIKNIIRNCEIDDVYHLEVSKNHNFFANNLCVHNCYRGRLGAALINNTDTPYLVKKGDRIAQLVVYNLIEPHISWSTEKDSTSRGENGFGSSGR